MYVYIDGVSHRELGSMTAARLGGLPSTCRRCSCFQILLAELVLLPNSNQGLTLMVWIVEFCTEMVRLEIKKIKSGRMEK